MMSMNDYFCHKSVGKLIYDPGTGLRDMWWIILQCDPGIVDYYAWYSKKDGRPVLKNKLWGSHVSVVKGETPEKGDWGHDFGEIEFNYAHTIRYDNGCHAWLDVQCEKLHEIRDYFGLPKKVNFGGHPRNFHLTLGRWRNQY